MFLRDFAKKKPFTILQYKQNSKQKTLKIRECMNGQNTKYGTNNESHFFGLFGGYQFYGYHSNLHALTCEEIERVTLRLTQKYCLIPFALGTGS